MCEQCMLLTRARCQAVRNFIDTILWAVLKTVEVMLVWTVTTCSGGLLSHLWQPAGSLNLSTFQNIQLITLVIYLRFILKDTCL